MKLFGWMIALNVPLLMILGAGLLVGGVLEDIDPMSAGYYPATFAIAFLLFALGWKGFDIVVDIARRDASGDES